jgi:molybdenum cofactor cytidylyltransferase
MSPQELAAVVLAAGMSSRMGKNKLLTAYKGEPLLMAVLRLVLDCGFGESILVISRETLAGIEIPAGFEVALNEKPEQGQGRSVALGARAASENSRGIMFFQADMPLLDRNAVLAIASAFDGRRIAVPEAAGALRSPAVFPVSLKGELASLRGDEGGRALFKKHPGLLLKAPFPDAGVFRDIDTAADFSAVLHTDWNIIQN